MPTAAAQPQTRAQKDRILATLPPGTSRVQVITEKGKTAWRVPAQIGTKEQIVLKGNGEPITMMGQPGRKKRVELAPVSDGVAEVQEAKEQSLEENALLQAIMDDPESDVAINLVLRGMAEEIASLEFERKEAERNGLDTSNVSMRRARVLKALGDTLLRRKEKLSTTSLDLDGKGFEIVFRFIMETYRLALTDCDLRPEQIETIFTKFSKRISTDWKEEAKARMRTSG